MIIRVIGGQPRAFVPLTLEEREAFGVKSERMLRYRYVWNKAHPDAPLKRTDVVHHIDGDTLNDALENLAKMDGASHAALHFKDKPKTVEHRARLASAVKAAKAKTL